MMTPLKKITMSQLPTELAYIVLHYLSFVRMECMALINTKQLTLIQRYLMLYPARINHLAVLLRLFPHQEWRYDLLSRNSNITWDLVCAYPDKPWNYSGLSLNSNITWDIVVAHPERPWDFAQLSANPNVTWDIIQAHPHIPWDDDQLSSNPNITWEIVQAYPERKWNYRRLSSHPNITWSIVQAYPDKGWDYRELSMNPNITWDIVDAHSDKAWDYFAVSTSCDITPAIMRLYPYRNWNRLYLYQKFGYSHLLASQPIMNDRDLDQFTRENYQSSKGTLTWREVYNTPDSDWSFFMLSLNEFKCIRDERNARNDT